MTDFLALDQHVFTEVIGALGLQGNISKFDVLETQRVLLSQCHRSPSVTTKSTKQTKKRALSVTSSSPRHSKRQHVVSDEEKEAEFVEIDSSSDDEKVEEKEATRPSASLKDVEKLVEDVEIKKCEMGFDASHHANFHSKFQQREHEVKDIECCEHEGIYSNGQNIYISTGYHIGCREMTTRLQHMLQMHREALQDGTCTQNDVTLVFHVRCENLTNHRSVERPNMVKLMKILEEHGQGGVYPRVHVYVGPQKKWYYLEHVGFNYFEVKKLKKRV